VRLIPILCGFSDLVLFFLTVSLATHRSTAKLLSVLAQTFTELSQKVRTVSVECHGTAHRHFTSSRACWAFMIDSEIAAGALSLVGLGLVLEPDCQTGFQ
jgi:hypothetical protein